MEKTTNRARMTAAHELTRATIAKYGKADYRATFALCLRAVWGAMPAAPAADSKPAAAPAMTARAEWEAMSGEQQAAAALAMVWHEVKRHIAETDENGEPKPNPFYFIVDTESAETCRNEMFLYIDRAIDRADKNGEALALAIHRAAHIAARAISRAEHKHAKALVTEKAESGEVTREYIIDNAAPTAEPIAPSPENALIVRDMIERAAADDTDRAIIAALAAGYIPAEIARRLDLSKMTISRRIEKIRARALADE